MMPPALPRPSPAVAAAFRAFPPPVRATVMALRGQVFAVAAERPEVGPLLETLKWGQPAYLTPETKAGSTVRLGMAKDGRAAVFVHCQTTILSEFRAVFGDTFAYDGNRALLVEPEADLPEAPVRGLIARALTYHLS